MLFELRNAQRAHHAVAVQPKVGTFHPAGWHLSLQHQVSQQYRQGPVCQFCPMPHSLWLVMGRLQQGCSPCCDACSCRSHPRLDNTAF